MGACRQPTIIDLFSGAGGMTRGFVGEGFLPVHAVESDVPAAATYAANFGESHVFNGPIEEFRDVPAADAVIGGPPCQGFSNLGKREDGDERNELWREFMRVALDSGASAFVFENVAPFLKTSQCDDLMETATSEGFEVLPLVLNAADFGAAQLRRRAILIGSRVGQIAPLSARHGAPPSEGQLPIRTVRDAIGHMPRKPASDQLPDRSFRVFGSDVPGPFVLHEIHVGRGYRPISLERFKRIRPGGNRFDLPEELLADCWKRHKSGSGDVMGRLEWHRPSVTIRTEFFKPEKGRYLHPQWRRFGRRVNRALTHAEAAAIQGFDESHTWCGTKVQIARQIGNAVPPPLAAAIARTVRGHLRDDATTAAPASDSLITVA